MALVTVPGLKTDFECMLANCEIEKSFAPESYLGSYPGFYLGSYPGSNLAFNLGSGPQSGELRLKSVVQGLLMSIACLAVASCSSDADNGGSIFATPQDDNVVVSNDAPNSATVAGDSSTSSDADATQTSQQPVNVGANGLTVDTEVLQNDAAEAVPMIMDCDSRLPCTVESDDGGLSLAIERVYRDPVTDRLSVTLALTTTRDTVLEWLQESEAVDNLAGLYSVYEQEFGGFYQPVLGSPSVNMLAGTTLLITQFFREAPELDAVELIRLSTGFYEAAVLKSARFSNIPINAISSTAIDCNFRLPCTWSAANDTLDVTLTESNGLQQTGRLDIRYQLAVSRDLSVEIVSGTEAVGNDGLVFKPRLHGLDGVTDYDTLEKRLVAGSFVSGFQNYFRQASRTTTSLKAVSLGLSVPATPSLAAPLFLNVPTE